MNDLTGIEKWRAVDGDNTLALDWPLTEDSHVWEIGGFEGRWVQQIWDKYHCHITVFEPQLWAVEKLSKRFFGIDKIDIRPYGLWIKEGWEPIDRFETDGATVIEQAAVPMDNKTGQGFFKNIWDEVYGFEFDIDLALMNIEGAEYTLIPFMANSGIINRLEYFWCQFHPNLNDFNQPLSTDIYAMMSKTHDMLWDCYPTAVAWKRR